MKDHEKPKSYPGLQRTVNKIDAINIVMGKITSWFSLILVLVVFSDVVMRYLFNTSYVFMQELEWHVFAVVFLFGAGYTLWRDSHVRVDVFFQSMSEKKKAWTDLLGTAFLLVPGCLLIIITSLPWIWESIKVWEGSPDPGGIPLRFILKTCLPIGFFFLLLQGVSLALKSLITILSAGAEE